MDTFELIVKLIEHWRDIIMVLGSVGIFIEITPIKINPVGFVCKWVGRKINAEVTERMDRLETKIEKMEHENYIKDSRDKRSEILVFASSCHNKVKHTNEEFQHILEQIEDYEALCEAHDIENGVIDAQAKYIRELYIECLREGTLL